MSESKLIIEQQEKESKKSVNYFTKMDLWDIISNVEKRFLEILNRFSFRAD